MKYMQVPSLLTLSEIRERHCQGSCHVSQYYTSWNVSASPAWRWQLELDKEKNVVPAHTSYFSQTASLITPKGFLSPAQPTDTSPPYHSHLVAVSMVIRQAGRQTGTLDWELAALLASLNIISPPTAFWCEWDGSTDEWDDAPEYSTMKLSA